MIMATTGNLAARKSRAGMLAAQSGGQKGIAQRDSDLFWEMARSGEMEIRVGGTQWRVGFFGFPDFSPTVSPAH